MLIELYIVPSHALFLDFHTLRNSCAYAPNIVFEWPAADFVHIYLSTIPVIVVEDARLNFFEVNFRS